MYLDESDDELSSIITPEDVDDYRDAFQRSGHIALGFDNELVIWGGSRCGPPTAYFNDFCDPKILWVYNTLDDLYTKREISGLQPDGSSGSCAVIHDDSLYIFGGFCRATTSNNMEYSNSLYRLNLATNKLHWQRMVPKGETPLPCDKLAGWAHGDKLYFFGGFGRRLDGCGDSTWIRDEMSDRGWNNQFFCYNTKTNSWEWPRTYGPKPRPRAAHSAAISGHTAYIFGGRLESVRNDELHSINLETMTWSGNLKSSMKGPHWPCGRSWHSFTFISPTVAFILGGMSTSDETLDDIWKITFENDAIECEMYPTHNIDGGELRPVLWHQSVYFPKGNEIITVGGMKQLYGGEHYTDNHYNRLSVLRFSPKSLFRLCLDVMEKGEEVSKADFNCLPAQLKTAIRKRLMNPMIYDTAEDNFFDEFMDGDPFVDDVDVDDYYHDEYDENDDDGIDDIDDDVYGVFDDDLGDDADDEFVVNAEVDDAEVEDAEVDDAEVEDAEVDDAEVDDYYQDEDDENDIDDVYGAFDDAAGDD